MKRGYTLVEIIVVLAILAVMATAAVPALGVWLNRKPDAVEAVAALVRGVRARALSEARAFTLTINPRTGGWLADDGESDPTKGALKLGDAGLSAVGDRIVIRFASTGGAEGGKVVVREHGLTTVIRADPWTGEVHIDGG